MSLLPGRPGPSPAAERVSQFNPDNPISELVNSLYTLLDGRNYMKIYENYFAQLSSEHPSGQWFAAEYKGAGMKTGSRSPIRPDYSIVSDQGAHPSRPITR
jgi:hypothetical protein